MVRFLMMKIDYNITISTKIHQNRLTLKKRDGTIARRANAVDELKLVSWKERKNDRTGKI